MKFVIKRREIRIIPGGEAVEVVPELVGRLGLGQARLVEAAEHIRVHPELVVLLLLLPCLLHHGG